MREHKKYTKGFYYINGRYDERCYYLTGEKKGNKWIYLSGVDENKKVPIPNPEWVGLFWTCLPDENEIARSEYSETNPLKNHPLKIK